MNWVRHGFVWLFRNAEHIWSSRKEKILKNEIKKKKNPNPEQMREKSNNKSNRKKNLKRRKHAQSRISKGAFKETSETAFLKERVEWYYKSKRLVCNLLAIRWKKNSNTLSFDNIVTLEELNFQVQCLLGRSFQIFLTIKKSLRM